MKNSISYYLLLALVTTWCLVLLLPSVISNIDGGLGIYSKPVYKFFSIICHQYESRSIHIFGYKMAVCARCTGIYFGFFMGCIIYHFVQIRIYKFRQGIAPWMIISMPMIIDVMLDAVGIHSATILTRFLTGLFFGIGAGLILVPILLQSISEFISTRTFIKGATNELKTR